MKRDAFSEYHPAVNFLYFLGAIGFGVVIQHPAYIAAGALAAGAYCVLLEGRRGLAAIGGLVPVFAVLAAVNPLFNTSGDTVLFTLFGRPYTLEALLYGTAVAGMFAAMMLWFRCYSAVLTSDKFTSLFGNLIPSLSLLLVMVLRLIPNLMRKARQLAAARNVIGKGVSAQASGREKLREGMLVLSALMDRALEGSIVTADAMRSRGYGAGKRTGFQIYRMTVRDWVLLAVLTALAAMTISGGGKAAVFTPRVELAPLTWGYGAYCLFLLIPVFLHWKEELVWRILRSGI